MRLAIVTSHPIQYQAPVFRELARRADVNVYFAHRANAQDQAAAGFNVDFEWDVNLLTGYEHHFLKNVARNPGLDHFSGCDTPDVGRRIRDGRPDALLVMGWHLMCFWQAIWAAKRAGIPVMVRGDSHLKTPRSIVKRAGKAVVYPLALRVFDAGLYVGWHSRRYWEHYGYPKHRLFFSPHCVDNDWFAVRATEAAGAALRAAHGISREAKVVLFAGKLLPLKRPLDVISAVALARADGAAATVLVAGSGLLVEALDEHAHASSVPLIQLGFCNQSQMPATYAAADVLVLPSAEETWGLVANEALACGVPIAVSDACGCALDLAADGTAGQTFPPGDVKAMAAAMKHIFDHPPTKQVISAMAARYSLGAAVDGMMTAFDSIAKRKMATA